MLRQEIKNTCSGIAFLQDAVRSSIKEGQHKRTEKRKHTEDSSCKENIYESEFEKEKGFDTKYGERTAIHVSFK